MTLPVRTDPELRLPGRRRVRPPATPGWSALRDNHVAQVVAVVVIIQLAYRGWATYGSWYAMDDFNFMSRMLNDGLSPAVALRQYAGHVMPAGMYLSWLATAISPYDFRVTGTFLMLMQLAADLGLVVLLTRLFGLRPGILPPLCIYLFGTISVPIAIWWAAGVNQLPLQVSLFWALACHVSYLRTRRLRHVASTVAWLVGGLLFYEKTLLVFGAIAILTLNYFVTGSFGRRLVQACRSYWPAVVAYVALGGLYLVYYAAYGLTFSPRGATANRDTFLETTSNMVVQGYLPATFGGPLRWERLADWIYPDPGTPLMVLGVVLAAALVIEIKRGRARSLRAWWLVVFFMGSNIALTVAGRASFVGALISLDFRYQGELAAVTAVALACAVMPIIGAPEQVDIRRSGSFLGRPRLVAAATVVVSVLGLVSSTEYVVRWRDVQPGQAYFANLLPVIEDSTSPVAMVDTAVPPGIMWGLGYPDNTLSHLLVPYADRVDFRTSAIDTLAIADEHGELVPAFVSQVSRGVPGPRRNCGYRVHRESLEIPLDAGVAFGGWWVRIGYLASAETEATVAAGDATHQLILPAGLHALYIAGGDQFDSVTISRENPSATLCTDDITVGRPEPVEENP